MSATTAPRDFRHLPLAEKEAIVARFEERVGAALAGAPPSREWVRRAMRRQGADRCPVRLKRLSLDIILEYDDALADLFCEYPDDVVGVIPYEITIGYQPPSIPNPIKPLQVMMETAEWADEWGSRWGHAVGGVGATQTACALADWSQLDNYLAHRMPDPRAPGRYDAAASVLSRYQADRYCFGIIHLALFERLHSLRGMENTFLDLHTNEAEVCRLLDALNAYVLELLRYWSEIGAHGVFLTDDWGSQQALMISLPMWRRIFKPYYRTLVEETHRLGMDFILHSCGNVTALIEDLIEIGVDALDPVQPVAMDPEEIGRRFGGRIAFMGGIDIQDVLTRGTLADVKREVHRVMDVLAKPYGNSLFIGPANVMTPDVPLPNLRALFEACHSS